MKKFQRFVGYVSAILLMVFLISSLTNSQVSLKSNGYLQNNNTNNITKVKWLSSKQQTRRVTRNNSDCAKELLQVLSQYIKVNQIHAEWSYNGTQYIYEEGTQTNNKPLKNKEKLVKLKVTQTPYNLIVSSDNQGINDEIINRVQNTFRNHGVEIKNLRVDGNFLNSGKACSISFPCVDNSYCVSSSRDLRFSMPINI